MNKYVTIILLVAIAAGIAFLTFVMSIVPGEFIAMKAGDIGMGAGNITSGEIHSVIWTALGNGDIVLKADKDGSIDRFRTQLFVDPNKNERYDSGEEMIFEGPLYMMQKSYNFTIRNGERVTLNYWYQVEKTPKPDHRINKARLMLDFGDSPFR